MQVNDTTISVVRGSLIEQEVQGIVNAANNRLCGGGGIDGLIHVKAGPGLLEELKDKAPGGCSAGEVVVTGGHDLNFEYIFHTPGPIWHGGESFEHDTLSNCYFNAMTEAHQLELESLGFCSVSTGIYGFPLSQAAPLALATIKLFLLRNPNTSLKKIVIACFQEEEYSHFAEAVGI